MSCCQSKCLSLPSPSGIVLSGGDVGPVLFQGTNQNEFQNFVGATGKASDVIPYTMAQDGEVVAFSASINGVNLNRTYTFYIVVDIPVGHVGLPPIENQLARVELLMFETITGTILFSCRRTEDGLPIQARASRKNTVDLPYLPIDAYATWTTVSPGTVIRRNQALSLYLTEKIGNEEAAFQVFVQALKL